MRKTVYVLPIATLLLIAGLAPGVPAQDAPSLEEGALPAELLGGGDCVTVSSPVGDAWMAVVHGSAAQTVKSPVSIVSYWTRAIGAAEVYNATGGPLNLSRPILVRSLVVHRLTAIYEFNDSDGNGVADVSRSSLPIAPDQVIPREQVYKAVSLGQEWTRGPVDEKTSDENGTVVKIWSFNLSARNLGYTVVGNESSVNASPGDGALNALTLTVHLTAQVRRGEAEVPFFNVSVSAGAAGATARAAGKRTYNVTTLSARAKLDQLIEGWDIDPGNANPRLVVEFHTMAAHFLPPDSPPWLTGDFVSRHMGALERVSYTPEGGDEVVIDGSGELRPEYAGPDASEIPRRAGPRRVNISDSWQRLGELTWAADASRWANESSSAEGGEALLQVQGFRSLSLLTDRGVFRGLLMLGGMSYPGGWRVLHDPELGMDMGWYDIPEIGPPTNHPPKARISSPQEGSIFKAGQSVRLDASGSTDPDGDTLLYVWMEGTKMLGNETIVSRKFSEGRHRVSLTIHDGRGEFDSANVTFRVEGERRMGAGEAAVVGALSVAVAASALVRRRR
ncbi:MAG: PKD domain-containing protein [Thermoplasmatota archaeon]